MHTKLILLSMLLLTGCAKPGSSGTLRQRLARGEKLFSYPGSCPKALAKNTAATGYFALENGELIASFKDKCKTKMKYKAEWLREDRISVSHPQPIQTCAGFKLDAQTKFILDFEKANDGYKLFSSQRAGCGWLRWTEG